MKFRIHAACIALALVAAFGLAPAPCARAVQLVTDETIKTQKDLTKTAKLKNGITVIIREIAGSDIVSLNLDWATGLRDLPTGKKTLNDWYWPALTMSSTAVPKEKVFETEEKFGLEIGCGGGIELSACSLNAINDYWHEGLGLFASLINTPGFTDDDLKLSRDRMVAGLKNTPSDPNNYVNEIINTIFYPVGHPYRLNHDEALAELDHLGKQDLIDLHKKLMNASLMTLVVATSMPAEQVVKDLDAAFGAVETAPFTPVKALAPTFDAKKAYSFFDRDLPTAFIKIKLNAPSATDKDSVAARVLYEILSEELGDEIRTKRSLSYAVHSFIIQYSLGIGVISASTSKPKETLEAIHHVLQTIKAKNYTAEEIDHYKRGFATGYYLTLETHGSLASALANSQVFYGTPNELYDMPRRLDAVTAADIKRLANEILADLRVGVIYGRKEFNDKWAQDLIKKNVRQIKPASEEIVSERTPRMPPKRSARQPFWRAKSLEEMTKSEWKSLCDGCARCCLNKYEDEDTKEIAYTDVACKLLNRDSCRCSDYKQRAKKVPDCISLTPAVMPEMNCLPPTCGYRLVFEGKDLYDWHPLKSGDPDSVHAAGISVRGRCVSEVGLTEKEIARRLVKWPMRARVRKS